MMIEAILFDFDGLLMDTESSMLASWQHEWRHHGLELDLDTFWVNHGGDVTDDRYALLAKAVGTSFNRAESHARRVAHRDHLHADLQFCNGIQEWLGRTPELHLRLAIASSSPREWVEMHLARVNGRRHFELLAGGDEVTVHKPDPAVYLLALDRLGVDPAHAIAVEDSPHGVVAAQAAGMQCVAIPNHHVDHNRFAHADLLLASAASMPLDDVVQALTPEDVVADR